MLVKMMIARLIKTKRATEFSGRFPRCSIAQNCAAKIDINVSVFMLVLVLVLVFTVGL